MTTTKPLLLPSPAAGLENDGEEKINSKQNCRRCSLPLLPIYLNNVEHLTFFGTSTNKIIKPSYFCKKEEKEKEEHLQPLNIIAAQRMKSNNESLTKKEFNNFSSSSMTAITSPPSVKFFPLFLDGISRSRQSRGECISPLELEALLAVQQFAVAVESIAVSEMLPRTPELIFVNLTTLEGQPHCLELTSKGWRVTSLRTDCMHGDFTKMEMFTNYYNTFNELMDVISPEYQKHLKERNDFNYNFRNSTEFSTNNSVSDSEELFSSNSSLYSSSSCNNCFRLRQILNEENKCKREENE
ncbi:hypothetical protein ACQ4LE_007021 [Meloidogyne hapla]